MGEWGTWRVKSHVLGFARLVTMSFEAIRPTCGSTVWENSGTPPAEQEVVPPFSNGEPSCWTTRKNDYVKKWVIYATLALVLANFAWIRSEYACDLTGRRMIVDRVLLFTVSRTIAETDVSSWLDDKLGPTNRREWGLLSRRSIYGTGYHGFMPRSQEVYDAFRFTRKGEDEFRNDLLESLKTAREEGVQHSLPPVSGTRGTPAAYAPVAPRIPER